VAGPQPKERGQLCPREPDVEKETRGQGCTRLSALLKNLRRMRLRWEIAP